MPDNLLLLTYPNRWMRHTQGHSLSIISYELNTCNVIIRCRPYPLWNCIDKWRNNWLCLVLRAACLRFDIRGIVSSDTRPHQYKGKTPLICNSSLISACHQRPRHCHGGLPTSIVLIHIIDTTPENGSMSDTVHARSISQTAVCPHWVSIHTNQPSIIPDIVYRLQYTSLTGVNWKGHRKGRPLW